MSPSSLYSLAYNNILIKNLHHRSPRRVVTIVRGWTDRLDWLITIVEVITRVGVMNVLP
ncbi:MAG: hypothetical protein IPO25_22635 [Saprospiraceae bacterium]|nr:hypothetical protein [Saprospiraceae bacterium]